MNKHSMAILFALIGFVVAGFLTDFSTLGIIFGVCLGIFVGYFVAGLIAAKGNILRENFIAMGTLAGKTLAEIEEKVGSPNVIQSCTIEGTGKSGTLCTWTAPPYSITLLFDDSNTCLCINKEISA